jgi:CO dehydrogenase maturation factor
MPKIIAFAGKGGVGKTTMAGMLVRYLLQEMEAGPVLAVDGDPNSNLNEILGVQVKATIGEAREEMKKDVPQGMTKDVWFEYKVNQAVVEGQGFDLLVMGRPEGPGCYCAANSLAKKYIDVLRENYAYVVVDNEAGMEHMSRLVTRDIDRLFVVSDATPRGLMTARRIVDLIKELSLNIMAASVIINRVNDGTESGLRALAEAQGLPVEGMVRNDEGIWKGDMEGKTIFSMDKRSPAFLDAYGIFKGTLNREDRP